MGLGVSRRRVRGSRIGFANVREVGARRIKKEKYRGSREESVEEDGVEGRNGECERVGTIYSRRDE